MKSYQLVPGWKKPAFGGLKGKCTVTYATEGFQDTLWGESQSTTMKSPPIVLGMEREQASPGTHPEQAYTFHPLHRS